MASMDLLTDLRAAATSSSLRSQARAAGVSLSTVQRVLAGEAVPSLRTMTLLGCVAGLRLELLPRRGSHGERSRAPGVPARPGEPGLKWSGGAWPEEDADYLLGLLGAELRHQRRYGTDVLRSAELVADDVGIMPVTLRRLERGRPPWTGLAVAERVALSLGFTLGWVHRDAPWRPRPWQLPAERGGRTAVMAAARRAHGRHRAALMTALDQSWTTPRDLIDEICSEHGPITLDAAAKSGDQVAEQWLGPDHPDPARRDALVFADWADLAVVSGDRPHAFLNPPFGTRARAFVERAVATARAGVPVTAVLPARVDTAVFQDLVFPHASDVQFLRGRLRYGRGDGRPAEPAPFPTALIRFAG
jgi:site-specific DNA-methyltransferase (adenine-specific)